MTDFKRDGSHLAYCPPVEKWDDWVELDPEAWPRRVEKHYQLVPTVCFNCESACGLAGLRRQGNREGREVRRQSHAPRQPRTSLRQGPRDHQSDSRSRPRSVSDEAQSVRAAAASGRALPGTKFSKPSARAFAKPSRKIAAKKSCITSAAPAHDFIMERTLQAWGIDGHNSHTNVCSSSARLGYLLWHYADRPSPDHANARFILLLSAHLESGHYFNPHAQRIIDGKMAGAKLAVMDPRLSNTASMADYWMPTYPGTEAAVLLAMAKVILDENRFDAAFVKNWTNWEELEIDGFSAQGPEFRRD